MACGIKDSVFSASVPLSLEMEQKLISVNPGDNGNTSELWDLVPGSQPCGWDAFPTGMHMPKANSFLGFVLFSFSKNFFLYPTSSKHAFEILCAQDTYTRQQ